MNPDQPVSRREVLKDGAKIVSLGLMGAMLASGAGGGLSLGQSDSLYIKKSPASADNIILPTSDLLPLKIKMFNRYPISPALQIFNSTEGAIISLSLAGGIPSFVMVPDPTVITATPFQFSTVSLIGWVLASFNGGLNSQYFTIGSGDGSGTVTVFDADGLSLNGGFGVGTTYADLLGNGGQVGFPTGTPGSNPSSMVLGNHRHAFSGRFSEGGFLANAVLAGLPAKFKRFKIANNFTVRRISVYALAGPTGGTESFGIVNAAGTLQGTAVVLPAGPGATEAEAAQTANLTGNTIYYIAETASAAGVTVPATNVSIDIEYTMNV